MSEPGRWRATYTPGSWLLLCGPAAAVVLEPADASWSDLVETLWDEVVSADSIGDLAARLAWYRIDTMPSFAAFFWTPGGMRSLVRGAVSVVDAESGDVVVTGEGVQTWVEKGLGDLRQVRVELPAERPAGTFPLPLVVGAVGVSAVFLDATDGAVPSSPQLDAEPDPEPVVGPTAVEDAVTRPELDPEPDASEAVTEAMSEAMTEAMTGPFLDDEPLGAPSAEDSPAAARDPHAEHENAETRWVPAMPPLEAVAPAPPGVREGPTLEAVSCPWGHPNPPGSSRCRVCDALVAVQPSYVVPAPVLALLRASNGDTAELVGSVLVGRAPARDRARVEDPELLTVTSPSHDISRTHLEVSAAGWDVVVTDLHSTNGTVVVPPGGAPRVMDPGESTPVALGTVLELADGITVLIDFPQ